MSAWTIEEAVRLGTGTERECLCPVHGDTHPSASVNVLKKVWYCYSCGARGKLTGEALLAEPDYYRMARRLRKKLETKIYPESWLNQFDAGPVHPYWLQRFDEQTARAERLGYDRETDSGTYPLRGPGREVLGVVRRSFSGDGPKYRYPYGVDVSRLLFGYTPAKRSVVALVEGAMDAIAMRRAGIDAFAIYGSRISKAQVDLIERIDPELVVLAFDRDRAGDEVTLEAASRFCHRMLTRLEWPKGWGKDVDEIGLDRLQKLWVSTLRSVGWRVESETCKRSTPSSSGTKLPFTIKQTPPSA